MFKYFLLCLMLIAVPGCKDLVSDTSEVLAAQKTQEILKIIYEKAGQEQTQEKIKETNEKILEKVNQDQNK